MNDPQKLALHQETLYTLTPASGEETKQKITVNPLCPTCSLINQK